MKRQGTDWEKILQNHICDKSLRSQIHKVNKQKTYSSIIRKQHNLKSEKHIWDGLCLPFR